MNAKTYEKEYPRAVKAIIEHHYVDDYVDSSNNIDEAQSVIELVVRMHLEGKFELRGFVSNSAEVLKKLNVTGKQLDMPTKLNQPEYSTEKILRLHWNHRSDVFCFVLNFKRQVLSMVISIFDPFGQ